MNTVYTYECSQCGKQETFTYYCDMVDDKPQLTFPGGWITGAIQDVHILKNDELVTQKAFVLGAFGGWQVGWFCSTECWRQWTLERLTE